MFFVLIFFFTCHVRVGRGLFCRRPTVIIESRDVVTCVVFLPQTEGRIIIMTKGKKEMKASRISISIRRLKTDAPIPLIRACGCLCVCMSTLLAGRRHRAGQQQQVRERHRHLHSLWSRGAKIPERSGRRSGGHQRSDSGAPSVFLLHGLARVFRGEHQLLRQSRGPFLHAD